jgi:glycosyltransferase involved in cell wall biosynthesis
LEIPADAFAVLTMADLRSSAARKNLLGAISIYMQAFPSPSSAAQPACLFVKVREDAAHPAFLRQARHAARGRPDIRFLTGDLSSEDMLRLIASCSLVLSPHRAEGFGLSLAEALLANVPVLATGWSGNVDFLAGLPEMTIDYSLVPVRDDYRVYRARGQHWAEPDAEDAVAKLHALAASPELCARVAAQGRVMIEALSAPWSREALLAMPFGSLIIGA